MYFPVAVQQWRRCGGPRGGLGYELCHSKNTKTFVLAFWHIFLSYCNTFWYHHMMVPFSIINIMMPSATCTATHTRLNCCSCSSLCDLFTLLPTVIIHSTPSPPYLSSSNRIQRIPCKRSAYQSWRLTTVISINIAIMFSELLSSFWLTRVRFGSMNDCGSEPTTNLEIRTFPSPCWEGGG